MKLPIIDEQTSEEMYSIQSGASAVNNGWNEATRTTVLVAKL